VNCFFLFLSFLSFLSVFVCGLLAFRIVELILV